MIIAIHWISEKNVQQYLGQYRSNLSVRNNNIHPTPQIVSIAEMIDIPNHTESWTTPRILLILK